MPLTEHEYYTWIITHVTVSASTNGQFTLIIKCKANTDDCILLVYSSTLIRQLFPLLAMSKNMTLEAYCKSDPRDFDPQDFMHKMFRGKYVPIYFEDQKIDNITNIRPIGEQEKKCL